MCNKILKEKFKKYFIGHIYREGEEKMNYFLENDNLRIGTRTYGGELIAIHIKLMAANIYGMEILNIGNTMHLYYFL